MPYNEPLASNDSDRRIYRKFDEKVAVIAQKLCCVVVWVYKCELEEVPAEAQKNPGRASGTSLALSHGDRDMKQKERLDVMSRYNNIMLSIMANNTTYSPVPLTPAHAIARKKTGVLIQHSQGKCIT